MAVKRYELNEVQWLKIAPLLPGKASDPGRTGADNRLFVNGCLWVLRSGAHWCDLPERYGKWKTVHKRFSRWCHGQVWERVFEALTADRDNQYLMIDSAIVQMCIRDRYSACRRSGLIRCPMQAMPATPRPALPRNSTRAILPPPRKHRSTARPIKSSARHNILCRSQRLISGVLT